MVELVLAFWFMLLAFRAGQYKSKSKARSEVVVSFALTTLVMIILLTLSAWFFRIWWVDASLELLDAHAYSLGVKSE